MVLPHMGDLDLLTYFLMKASSSFSASASVVVLALTFSVRPLRPWVPVFQASMALSSASSW